tara:strand:+ start:1510 stop:2181 length:672 start_codon:yes stop_codon:yes gene_type:complete
MKLSKETIEVLKNFSGINQSIVVKEGNKLKTVNSLKNILAHATVEENFPKEFAIYDLTEFLGLLSSISEPELTFNKSDVTVSSDTRKVKYRYADTDYIVKPEKDIDMPESEIKFKLSEEVYVSLEKVATILQLHDICLKGCKKSGKILLCATNKKNDSSNDYSEEVGEGVTKNFNIVMKKENLKIIPSDYDVSISSKGISHFKNVNLDLEYWIALEPTSEYGE